MTDYTVGEQGDEDVLTVEGLRTIIAAHRLAESDFEAVTVSRETVDELRRLSVPDIRTAMSTLLGLPMLQRSDGNFRVIHPRDRGHLAYHDGGRPGCRECWRIWGGTYR